jgi:hypothetical protein
MTTNRVNVMVMMMSLGFVVLVLNACLPAQPERPESPAQSSFKPLASVQQIMTIMTIPASDAIFGAAGDPPKADGGWLTIQNNALMLAESGNLLMLPGRAQDNQEWLQQSLAMIDAARTAYDAAGARNGEKLAEAGDKIYATCETCHDKYMAK